MPAATASAVIVAAALAAAAPAPILLPGGEAGIGFDDLRYSDELHELLVPAGRTGRGIELDAARGLAFVGCEEGKVVSLDVVHGGRVVGEAKAGEGVGGIAYSSRLGHLYVPAADSAILTIVGVGARGELEVLGVVAAAPEVRCAAADNRANVFVCAPKSGRLLVVPDSHPAAR